MTEKPTTIDAALSDAASEVVLDTTGLICPEPIMLLHRAIRKIQSGEQIRMRATDPSTQRDVPKFCLHLGHTLVSKNQKPGSNGDEFEYLIQKA